VECWHQSATDGGATAASWDNLESVQGVAEFHRTGGIGPMTVAMLLQNTVFSYPSAIQKHPKTRKIVTDITQGQYRDGSNG